MSLVLSAFQAVITHAMELNKVTLLNMVTSCVVYDAVTLVWIDSPEHLTQLCDQVILLME